MSAKDAKNFRARKARKRERKKERERASQSSKNTRMKLKTRQHRINEKKRGAKTYLQNRDEATGRTVHAPGEQVRVKEYIRTKSKQIPFPGVGGKKSRFCFVSCRQNLKKKSADYDVDAQPLGVGGVWVRHLGN